MAGHEQTFFDDPALDRAVGMIMALAAELYVVKDRLRSLERTLEEAGIVEAGALDRYRPEPEEEAAITAERDAFVAALLSEVLGRPRSLSSGGSGDTRDSGGDGGRRPVA